MNTDNIWTALSVSGNVKIPQAHIYRQMPPGSSIDSEIQRIHFLLHAEAAEEGVGLWIKSYYGGLDISLRKFT